MDTKSVPLCVVSLTLSRAGLPQECQDLMDRGVRGSGVGFDANSMGRLGGRGPVAVHNPDPRKLRDVAVKVMLGAATALLLLLPALTAAAAA